MHCAYAVNLAAFAEFVASRGRARRRGRMVKTLGVCKASILSAL
jgi:hypothetical protein